MLDEQSSLCLESAIPDETFTLEGDGAAESVRQETRLPPVSVEAPRVLSDDEREQVRAEIRATLEREHEARIGRLEKRKDRAESKHALVKRQRRESEISQMRQALREEFYREKGYRQVMDQGRERWVPAEEYAWRQRRHSRKRAPSLLSTINWREHSRNMPIYFGVVLVAVVLGYLLVR